VNHESGREKGEAVPQMQFSSPKREAQSEKEILSTEGEKRSYSVTPRRGGRGAERVDQKKQSHDGGKEGGIGSSRGWNSIS